MTTVVLPFLMSMLLGRTIDLRTYSIGESVYDNAVYDEMPLNNTIKTMFNVLQDDSLPNDFFGIPADIVLRIKNNFLSSASGIMGLDGVLKDTSWKYNSAVIGVVSIYQTVRHSLAKNSTQLPNWENRIPKAQTHYADSLLYGGWLVVLFRFKCDIAGDVPTVRKAITAAIGVIGEVEDNIEELYKKVSAAIENNQDIRGRVQISEYVYSSVNLNNEVNTPEGMTEILQEFRNKVGDLGQPLFMTLESLHHLDDSYPEVEENLEILAELQKMDDMMDDVKVTKVSMMRWMQESLKTFSDEEEQRISELLNTINNCIRAFSKISGQVSLYRSSDTVAIETAIKKYVQGLKGGVWTYNLAYMKLKEELDAECDNSFLNKIKGLLKVYESEKDKVGKVRRGLEECQEKCREDDACRAIGYADELHQLDITTGLYYRTQNQCWIYFRSTSTATVHTPVGLSGDMGVYDRNCYLR